MKLWTVLALVVVFVRTTHGMETTCDATQNVSCYGTLGQPLYLQLIRTTKDYELHFYRQKNPISRIFRFTTKWSTSTILDAGNFSGRWTFFSDNGTLFINPVELTDLGKYRVQIFSGNGTKVADNYVWLIVNETTPMTTPMTLTISNATYPPLNNDGKRTMSKEQWNIIFGGLFYYCKRTKSTYRTAEPEELVYAAVTIHNRQAKQSDQRERQEETVEYGEVNVQRGHTPVDPDQCFSLALYAEVKTRHNK
ncbi:uncharacterized protein LOC143132241 isoform X2 [Alosa pseudoharengus]|uniref:uncharacterized protein LOC143132241 isoform X2 n=1 Tax=Alosa pseudoharengus TaxID=34774 RepID=UPI003F89BCFD